MAEVLQLSQLVMKTLSVVMDHWFPKWQQQVDTNRRQAEYICQKHRVTLHQLHLEPLQQIANTSLMHYATAKLDQQHMGHSHRVDLQES